MGRMKQIPVEQAETARQACPACGAGPNQPCRVIGAEHLRRRTIHAARWRNEKWWSQPRDKPQEPAGASHS